MSRQTGAIVFDFDGLILDTETPELEVWTQTFLEHGVEMPADYWATIIGRGAEQEMERPHQLLARLTGNYIETPEKHEERRMRIRAKIASQDARPGIRALIASAHADGIPIAIASSSLHTWVDRYLQVLGLASAFVTVCCADDVTRAKPFPDLYLLACERLGQKPSDCIALEDSPNGIAAARTADLFTITYPNSVTAGLDVGKAHHRFDSLDGVTAKSLFQLKDQLSQTN